MKYRGLLGLVSLSLGACAGPTTPLGAITALHPSQATEESRHAVGIVTQTRHFASIEPEAPEIDFHPRRQVLHGKRAVTVQIRDHSGARGDYDFHVLYNGRDVTRSFLKQAHVYYSHAEGNLHFTVPGVRLPPEEKERRIEVIYGSPSGTSARALYEEPTCDSNTPRALLTTEHFRPSALLLDAIEHYSQRHGFNPVFSAALIAQESGFRLRSVSWARAVGLTQVTPIADRELAETYKDWPRHPAVSSVPVPILKAMVMSRKIHSLNDWRLHPERSIDGGLAFAQILNKRWQNPDNIARVRSAYGFDPVNVSAARTRLLLASYHSGYARVLSALARRGKEWMTVPELGEARKYVNRIMSYCDHFSEKSGG